MFGLPGGIEWIIVLIIVLLLFGKRIPQVMRSLGQGISEFKQGQKEAEEDQMGEDSEQDRLPEGERPKDDVQSAEEGARRRQGERES